MNELKRKIPMALYLKGWSFENGDKKDLLHATYVTADEYQPEMKGHLFCPQCCVNLNRVPHNKDIFTSNRTPHFKHALGFTHVACSLHSNTSPGKSYQSYEEVKRAVDDEQLAIIHSFNQDFPEISPNLQNKGYDETVVEDVNGPPSDRKIGRHDGKTFKVPTVITTVGGICRNFDRNLYKYFLLPDFKYSLQLKDLLINVNSVSETDNKPKFYYGKITSTGYLVNNPQPYNINMVELECHSNVKDFNLKVSNKVSIRKGLSNNSIDRYVLIYGKVSDSGIGLAFTSLGWGEFALIPSKYNKLLS